MTGSPTPGYRRDPGVVASAVPAPIRAIGFDQNLDQPVPLDAELTDERGSIVRLGQYFGSRTVVLAFVYYDCPMLCTLVLNSIASTLAVLPLDAGKDFELLVVSFDPRETPALASSRKAAFLTRYSRPTADAGSHFLTGTQHSIARLTKAVGFRYVWDEPSGQWAHPAGITVLTPDGRLARYLFGLEFGPRDLRLALVEASNGNVGTAIDAVVLYCYHYDPMTGRYGFVVMRALRIAGAATVLAIGTFILIMLRREKRERES